MSASTLGAWAGMIGPVLFVVVFTVDGWLRPDYDSLGMYNRVEGRTRRAHSHRCVPFCLRSPRYRSDGHSDELAWRASRHL